MAEVPKTYGTVFDHFILENKKTRIQRFAKAGVSLAVFINAPAS
jgi:hypothetical protein